MNTYFGLFITLAILGLLFTLEKRQVHFNIRVLLSLFLGIVCGIGFKLVLANDHSGSTHQPLTQTLTLIGSGYIDLLKMLVIPLILSSIIFSIINLGSHKSKAIGKLALGSVFMILILTAFSAAIGIAVGLWFHVGQGLSLPAQQLQPQHHYDGFVNTILGMLPSNPIASMQNGNMMAVVLFAIMIGLAGLFLEKSDPEKCYAFKQFIGATFQIMKKLASIVINLTPYGVFALLTEVTMQQGASTLSGLVHFLLAMYVAMLLVLIMHGLILLAQGKNIIQYYKYAYAPLLVAFITRSSFGTLPISEETLKNKLGLKQITASFVPSMGATIGMNACAGIFPAMLAVTAMTILHEPITLTTVITIMCINALASLGVSGIPGTAFVAAGVSLTALGLPYSVIALVQGIDPIIDMGRTATNVNGMMTTAITMDRAMEAEVDTENSIECLGSET